MSSVRSSDVEVAAAGVAVEVQEEVVAEVEPQRNRQ